MNKEESTKKQLAFIIWLLVTVAGPRASAEESIPNPESWSFPEVVDSARKLSPTNVEGHPFNRFGLVYSSEHLATLHLSSMPAIELQKYADVVTHAYPDAVVRGHPASCEGISVGDLNETAVAGIAYVSLHAINEKTRRWAAQCLSVLQEKLREHGR
jgi:hypothetical protein